MSDLLTDLRLQWLKARYEAPSSPAAAKYAERLLALIEQAKQQAAQAK